MQFSIASVVALFAATAVARPVAAPVDASVSINALSLEAESIVSFKVAAGCQLDQCIHELADTVAACAFAVASLGLNPLANLACLAEIHDDIHNIPDVCKAC